MKKWGVLLLSMIVLLAACGKKYDEEINKVTKLEVENTKVTKDSNDKKIERKNSDYRVYDSGNVITMTYIPFKDSNIKTTEMYKLNQSNNKYEKDYNNHAKEFERSNKPDYEENNMSK